MLVDKKLQPFRTKKSPINIKTCGMWVLFLRKFSDRWLHPEHDYVHHRLSLAVRSELLRLLV